MVRNYQVVLFGMLTGFVLAFQNCGTVKFDGSAGNSELVAKLDGGQAIGGDPSMGGGGAPQDPPDEEEASSPPPGLQNPPAPPIAHQPPSKDPKDPPCPKGSGQPPVVRNPSPKDPNVPPPKSEDPSASGGYACVLEGNGKSMRVALSSKESPEGLVGHVQEDVCMSRHACLGIVSQAFRVQSAEHRGWCGKVRNLNDDEVSELIAKTASP